MKELLKSKFVWMGLAFDVAVALALLAYVIVF
jgi:hypothetical protein